MWLEFAGPEQDPDAFAAQRVNAVLERRPPGESRVDEGQDHDWNAKAGRFGEDAEGVGVADAVGPLVDGVVGGGGDDDRVGPRGPSRAAVLCDLIMVRSLAVAGGLDDETSGLWPGGGAATRTSAGSGGSSARCG